MTGRRTILAALLSKFGAFAALRRTAADEPPLLKRPVDTRGFIERLEELDGEVRELKARFGPLEARTLSVIRVDVTIGSNSGAVAVPDGCLTFSDAKISAVPLWEEVPGRAVAAWLEQIDHRIAHPIYNWVGDLDLKIRPGGKKVDVYAAVEARMPPTKFAVYILYVGEPAAE